MSATSYESQPFSASASKESASEQEAVARAAGVVGFWTVLSRILGFLRDMCIALFMGAGLGADAFFVAFRIPNLLRRLLGEGAISAAFVPTYVEALQHQGREEAERLARVTFTVAAIILAVVTALGILLSPWIVRLMAPGFFEDPEKFSLTVDLNRVMFPYIFFIGLVALASGVLNSLGHFAAPAAAPIVLNLCMIGAISLLTMLLGVPAHYALAWGVLVSGLLQLVLQVPFMERARIRVRPDFHFGNPALKRIGRLFVPAALGGAVYQINVLVGTILASLLSQGSVSWLYYADRLVELPLGVFAIALGTAVLPSMSRQAGRQDMAGLGSSLSFALRLTALVTIPATVGLILLREPIVSVLFQRGRFQYFDTQQTAYALLWYTAGLWAFSALKLVNQTFFSIKDTRTPLLVSVGAVAVNLIAGIALMGYMAHGGLALATSLAAAFNVLVLFRVLVVRLHGFPAGELLDSLGRTSAASLLMGAALFWMRDLGQWELGLTSHNLLILVGSLVTGTLLFCAASYAFRSPELLYLARMLRERLHGPGPASP